MTQKNSENMEAALPLNSPVTLVVKTPNQRHEDVQVDCEIDWTVQKLKTHLSNVYPTKPVGISFCMEFRLLKFVPFGGLFRTLFDEHRYVVRFRKVDIKGLFILGNC